MIPISPTSRSGENSGFPTYRIEIKRSASKELAALPEATRRKIDQEIQALARDPRPPGCRALLGKQKGFLRIRSGNYRVIYPVVDDRLIVFVDRIGDRRDIYEDR